jgi:hypothetical protein
MKAQAKCRHSGFRKVEPGTFLLLIISAFGSSPCSRLVGCAALSDVWRLGVTRSDFVDLPHSSATDDEDTHSTPHTRFSPLISGGSPLQSTGPFPYLVGKISRTSGQKRYIRPQQCPLNPQDPLLLAPATTTHSTTSQCVLPSPPSLLCSPSSQALAPSPYPPKLMRRRPSANWPAPLAPPQCSLAARARRAAGSSE